MLAAPIIREQSPGGRVDRTERFYKIELLLKRRRVVTFHDLRDALEVSPATLKRDIRYLRERMFVPILWDSDAGGYCLALNGGEYHLPGLWFSAPEVQALVTLQHLVSRLDPAGILADHVEPLRQRLEALLENGPTEAEQLRRRVRIVGLARRGVQPNSFQRIGSALVQRKRLRISYLARSTGMQTEREVSPLRLMHYRDNWYLDAWCHLRKALRSFAVDAIQEATALEKPAKDVSDAQMDALFGSGYGIFSGLKVRWARLRFSPERARWVAKEEWHPQQKGRWDEQGRWLLDVPYADPRELVMDILKHVPDVEVLGPQGLRAVVFESLRRGLEIAAMLDEAAGREPVSGSRGDPRVRKDDADARFEVD